MLISQYKNHTKIKLSSIKMTRTMLRTHFLTLKDKINNKLRWHHSYPTLWVSRCMLLEFRVFLCQCSEVWTSISVTISRMHQLVQCHLYCNTTKNINWPFPTNMESTSVQVRPPSFRLKFPPSDSSPPLSGSLLRV